MRKTNFDEEQFSKLQQKQIDGVNSESTIYYFNKYVIKYFKEYVDLDSKYNVLNFFDEFKEIIGTNLPEIVLPDSLFYLNDKFCGYVMKNIHGQTLKSILESDDISFEYKRNYLVKLGQFLEKMDDVRRNNFELRSLFISDLHSNNVIVTSNESLRIIEVDSMRVSSDSEFSSYYLNQPYFSKMYKLKNKYDMNSHNIIANRESDLYCYIMMVLEFISGMRMFCMQYPNYEYYIKKLRDMGLPVELFEIFMNVYSEEENVNPYKLLNKINGHILL